MKILISFLFIANFCFCQKTIVGKVVNTTGVEVPFATVQLILKDKIIEEKNKGKLILITSHILSELDNLVTQIVFMQDGNLIFHRSVAELKETTQEQKISKAISKILKEEVK